MTSIAWLVSVSGSALLMAYLLGRIAISIAEQGSIGKVQVFTFFSAFASICTKLTLVGMEWEETYLLMTDRLLK
jgi:hypothetical protein